jgi:protein TonB
MFAEFPALAATADLATFSDPPKALYQPSPNYSARLRHEEVEGRVVVSFLVDPSGEVRELRIVQTTEQRLNRPTLEAMRQWRFSPALKRGVPVSCRVVQGVTYSIDGK